MIRFALMCGKPAGPLPISQYHKGGMPTCLMCSTSQGSFPSTQEVCNMARATSSILPLQNSLHGGMPIVLPPVLTRQVVQLD